MNPGIVFLIAGILLVVTGATLPWAAGFLVVSLGIAYLGIGICYVTGSPRWFFKRAGGRLSPLSFLIFWPYHLLNWISLQTLRLVVKEPAFDEIVPGLYLGRRLWLADCARLEQSGAVSVLDLTCELGEATPLRRSGKYLCIPVLDRSRPTRAEFDQGIRFIRERLQAGPVYVHCAMGHGRSAIFVIGYLVSAGIERDLERAIEHVRGQRPRVKLHVEQLRLLQEM